MPILRSCLLTVAAFACGPDCPPSPFNNGGSVRESLGSCGAFEDGETCSYQESCELSEPLTARYTCSDGTWTLSRTNGEDLACRSFEDAGP